MSKNEIPTVVTQAVPIFKYIILLIISFQYLLKIRRYLFVIKLS